MSSDRCADVILARRELVCAVLAEVIAVVCAVATSRRVPFSHNHPRTTAFVPSSGHSSPTSTRSTTSPGVGYSNAAGPVQVFFPDTLGDGTPVSFTYPTTSPAVLVVAVVLVP